MEQPAKKPFVPREKTEEEKAKEAAEKLARVLESMTTAGHLLGYSAVDAGNPKVWKIARRVLLGLVRQMSDEVVAGKEVSVETFVRRLLDVLCRGQEQNPAFAKVMQELIAAQHPFPRPTDFFRTKEDCAKCERDYELLRQVLSEELLPGPDGWLNLGRLRICVADFVSWIKEVAHYRALSVTARNFQERVKNNAKKRPEEKLIERWTWEGQVVAMREERLAGHILPPYEPRGWLDGVKRRSDGLKDGIMRLRGTEIVQLEKLCEMADRLWHLRVNGLEKLPAMDQDWVEMCDFFMRVYDFHTVQKWKWNIKCEDELKAAMVPWQKKVDEIEEEFWAQAALDLEATLKTEEGLQSMLKA